MEVASPLSYVPAGTKRSLSCSPGVMGRMESGAASAASSPIEMEASSGFAAASAASLLSSENNLFGLPPPAKRRRHLDASVDSLSEVFSSHSPFFNSGQKNPASAAATSSTSLFNHQRKRSSTSSPSAGETTASITSIPPAPSSPHSSPRRSQQSKHDELQAQIDEQAALIESLKTDKATMATDLAAAKLQADRSQKENALLRRAVTIQQEKHHHIESQLRDAKSQKAQADDKIRMLEQMVVTLRYHLQAAQVPAGSGQMNDFMGMPPRPPDVY